MSKPINMATGGLMSMPPYLKDTRKEDKGITPYDVNTPDSARKGLPQRGLSASRTRYRTGDGVKPLMPSDIPELEQHEIESGDVAWLNKKDLISLRVLEKKEAMQEHGGKKMTPKEKQKLNDLKKKDKEQEAPKKKAALGGYMDNFQISQEEPLSKFSIGGQAALKEKYDRRKDYKAYAEGDVVIAEE